jgi:dipeptidyl aminopeptidase/acylaminoacyl peptidase
VPTTDIYLIKVTKEPGKYTFGEPVNITNREGYDNQPFFMPDGRTILYVSIRTDKKGHSQADVYKYDIKKKKTKRVTKTYEDEYSPTLMPDGKHISVVRVEKDSTQRLWKFNLKGKKPELILPNIKGVGYHAWRNDSEVVLFMLGDTFSLQMVNINTGETKLIDKNVGRSFQVAYLEWAIFFVSKKDSASWSIMERTRLNHDDPKIQPQRLVKLPKGVEDFTVDADYNFYVGCNGQLFYYGKDKIKNEGIENKCTDFQSIPSWQVLHDFNGTPVANFYRLVFTKDLKYLALVVYSGAKP